MGAGNTENTEPSFQSAPIVDSRLRRMHTWMYVTRIMQEQLSRAPRQNLLKTVHWDTFLDVFCHHGYSMNLVVLFIGA